MFARGEQRSNGISDWLQVQVMIHRKRFGITFGEPRAATWFRCSSTLGLAYKLVYLGQLTVDEKHLKLTYLLHQLGQASIRLAQFQASECPERQVWRLAAAQSCHTTQPP